MSTDTHNPSQPPKPPGQTQPIPEPTKTGRIPFSPKGKDVQSETFYLIWGDLSSNKTPLICLHGGPGAPHSYLLPISHLAKALGIPVIMYDQMGCGQSSHFRDKRLDSAFWTPQLFMEELDNLKAHLNITAFDLLGHSWGGMLSVQYATTGPKGLRKLLLCDTPCSMVTWLNVADKLRRKLPADVQKTLMRCEGEGQTETEEYEQAVLMYYSRHVCRLIPWPKELSDSFAAIKEDDTVYTTMNGPSELLITGSLKTWDITSQLHKISVSTLLVNGFYDGAQDEVMEPFFREIAKVKWIRFALSSFVPHLEETEDFLTGIGEFITAE